MFIFLEKENCHQVLHDQLMFAGFKVDELSYGLKLMVKLSDTWTRFAH